MSEQKTVKKRDTRTMAQKRRALNQDELREFLSKQKHIEHVIKICGELDNEAIEMDAVTVNRKKTVIDTKLKLLNKYLPDLKAVEVTGEGGSELTIKVTNYGG